MFSPRPSSYGPKIPIVSPKSPPLFAFPKNLSRLARTNGPVRLLTLKRSYALDSRLRNVEVDSVNFPATADMVRCGYAAPTGNVSNWRLVRIKEDCPGVTFFHAPGLRILPPSATFSITWNEGKVLIDRASLDKHHFKDYISGSLGYPSEY